jgi:hypothetical protein
MQKQTINELISEIRQNENIIHRLQTVDNMMYDFKWNDSEKLFFDDKRIELETDEFLSILENFIDTNINNLMRLNKVLFDEIKGINE